MITHTYTDIPYESYIQGGVLRMVGGDGGSGVGVGMATGWWHNNSATILPPIWGEHGVLFRKPWWQNLVAE